jgi:hypothetical protein
VVESLVGVLRINFVESSSVVSSILTPITPLRQERRPDVAKCQSCAISMAKAGPLHLCASGVGSDLAGREARHVAEKRFPYYFLIFWDSMDFDPQGLFI